MKLFLKWPHARPLGCIFWGLAKSVRRSELADRILGECCGPTVLTEPFGECSMAQSTVVPRSHAVWENGP